jgi:hypothetical protein
MGEGNLGGEEAGVRKSGTPVIISRKESSCRSDKALCSVSRGLMGGTPPKPSIAKPVEESRVVTRAWRGSGGVAAG